MAEAAYAAKSIRKSSICLPDSLHGQPPRLLSATGPRFRWSRWIAVLWQDRRIVPTRRVRGFWRLLRFSLNDIGCRAKLLETSFENNYLGSDFFSQHRVNRLTQFLKLVDRHRCKVHCVKG